MRQSRIQSAEVAPPKAIDRASDDDLAR
jgi:hypothetical protein